MKTHVCINKMGWMGAITLTPKPGPNYGEEVTVLRTHIAGSGMGYELAEYPGMPWCVNQFEEIQPPMDITELIEECKTEKV